MKKTTMLIFVLLLITIYARAWNTPSIVSPADGADRWTGSSFDWNAVTNTQYYQFQLDINPSFNSAELYTLTNAYINSSGSNTDTRASIIDMRFGVTYYWRVRAWVTGDTSAWSTTRSIITRDYVTASSPITNGNYWTGVRLNWAPHDGVAKYEWQADTTTAFNSTALKTGQNNYVNSTDGNVDTQHDLSDIYFGQQYYWRVRAINNFPDTSAWTQAYGFTTRDYVTLLTPADGAVNRNVAGFNLDWDAHDDVDYYQVQLDSSSLFNSPFLKNAVQGYVNTSGANVDTRYATGALAANTIYFWRVRAINAIDTSAWTQWAFNTGSTPIVYPSAPTLVAPANSSAIVGTGTTLQWNTVANATSYYYEYDNDINLSSPQSGTITGTSVAISGLGGSSTYYWRVKALNGNLPSPYSSKWSFTTPVGGITTNDPSSATYCSGAAITVSFSSTSTFSGSSAFTLQLSDAAGNFGTPTSIGTATGASVTSINGTLPAGAATGSGYKVRVVSTNPAITGTPNTNALSIINTSVAPVITGTNGTACQGSTVTLTAPAVSGANYMWLLPDNSNETTQSITISNFGVADTGTYGVMIMMGSCFSPPGGVNIQLGTGPATPVVNSNANAICQGETLSLSTAAQTNATYAWSGPASFTSSQQNPTRVMPANGAGTYSVTVTLNGCTATGSKAITVNASTASTIDTTVCFGQSVLGRSISGTYRDTLTGANTCDSIRTLILTVRPQITGSETKTICFGQTYAGHSTSGTFTDTYTAANGCDSVRTLNLTIMPQITSTINQSICMGQTYAGHSTNGTYTDTYQSSTGCDSIRTLNLTVVSQITTTVTQAICFGQTYAGHSTSGTFTDTYSSSGGCDSVRTLNLTVRSQITGTETRTICFGQTYAGHSTSGTFTDTYTAANGCDSTRTLTLVVRPQQTSSESRIICFGDTYQGHSTSGTYTTTLTGSFGCDSTVVLNLTVRPANVTTINHTICQGESFEGHTTPGTYTDTYNGSNGCDSLRTLVLTVNAGIAFSDAFGICSNDTLIVNGNRVTTTGIYTAVVPSTTGGCDTVYTLDITVLQAPATPEIVYDSNSGTIHVTGNFTLLQWYKDGIELQGEIFDFINISGNGVYTLVAESFQNRCTATSNAITIGTGTGISQVANSAIRVFPVPTNGMLNLEFTKDVRATQAAVKDLSGKEVMSFNLTGGTSQLDISQLAGGMYLLHVTGADFSGIYKIVKE